MAKQHFLISLLPHVTPKSAWPTSIFLSAIYRQQLANQHFTPPRRLVTPLVRNSSGLEPNCYFNFLLALICIFSTLCVWTEDTKFHSSTTKVWRWCSLLT